MTRNIKVLVTGGSGQLAQVFLQHYGEQYQLRLTYYTRPFEAPGHEVIRVDLADYGQVLEAMEGIEAVVHLGADTRGSAPWDSILRNNIVGTYHVFEAARQAGVRRIVYASSNHAAGYALAEQDMIGPDAPVRPDSLYGVSKCFGEALGSYYHDRHGLDIVCLRIGSSHGGVDEDKQRVYLERAVKRGGSGPYSVPQYLSIWLSSADMSQLIHRSLQAECAHGIYYGISDNTPPAYDLSETRCVLGYAPQDDVQDLFDEPIASLGGPKA